MLPLKRGAGRLDSGSALAHRAPLDEFNLTFPANANRQGIRSQTYAKMHRLSNADDMLGR